LAHLTDVQAVVPMVPKWLPWGREFWTVLTGIAFVLAGIAILSKMLDVLAARLLALMLLVFSALALAPLIVAYPRDHGAWGGNEYNLAAVAAVWIFAESLASRDAQGRHDAKAQRPEVS
jgi:predicted tellurium resistance membrane protein TerC